ncbi:fungal trichothecene efflux pump [Coniochaeta sp. 2T2.1]|nr:fungal trichothecene efflux pump [Coniochaeta sp. 2T2.1]
MATTTGTDAVAAHDVEHITHEKEDSHIGNVEHVTDEENVPAERPANYIPENDDDYNVTFKTWIVVAILSWSYGVSFWIVPPLSAAMGVVSTQLGDPSAQAWYIPIYTLTITVAFMVCGANSDLFGRRWFIIGGNVLLLIGFLVGATAKTNTNMLIGMAFIGFGAGNAQLAAFALPELLPNKWRHIAIVIADIGVLFDVVVGPVAGRFAAVNGEAWRWLFYGPVICVVPSFIGLYLYYYPPAHPRGLPFKQAMKELDYGGAILFTVSAVLILIGVVYTTLMPSSDPHVIGTLVPGFVILVIFALYETYMPLKQPLTPSRVFKRGRGRELTAPFIAAAVVTANYYGINVVWPTMINVFFTDATTSVYRATALTLPANLGLLLGAVALSFFGTAVGHWRWTLTGSVSIMVLFGALLALGNPDRFGMMTAFVFLGQVGFGWAQYLSIAYVQFGTDQVELGIAGGLAGVARFAGGAIAISVYTTVLTNSQAKAAADLIPKAAEAAGLAAENVPALIAAMSAGADALAEVPGITEEIIAAAFAAFKQTYVVGLRTTALTSLAFGIVGIIACLCCQDISPKMNKKIEVFLENDVNAEKNKFH